MISTIIKNYTNIICFDLTYYLCKGAKLSLDECFHKFADKVATAEQIGRLTSRIQGPPNDLTEGAKRKN